MMENDKRILPQKARKFTDLIKECYKAGFKPLPKAMKEASRRWKLMSFAEKKGLNQ